MISKKKIKSEINRTKELLDNAWFGLGSTADIEVINPLQKRSRDDIENPHIHLLRFIRKPENLFFTAKHIFNLDLPPFQLVVIKKLWTHQFPLLIGARGFSKSWSTALYLMIKTLFTPGLKCVVVGAAFRQSKVVHDYCEKIWKNAPVLRSIVGEERGQGPSRDIDRCVMRIGTGEIISIPIGCLSADTLITTNKGIFSLMSLKNKKVKVWANNKFKDIGFFYENGISQTYKIITKKGFTYVGTPNHKMKVVRDNVVQWVRTDEMKIGDYILIDRTRRWHKNDTEVSVNDAYVLGIMIGDGSYVNKYFLRYTSINNDFLPYLEQSFGKHEGYYDGLHYQWNGKKLVSDWLNKWELKPAYSYQKFLPDKILCSSKEKMAACLSGLFDTDGRINLSRSKGYYSCVIGYTTTSKILHDQIKYLLLHFGIIASSHIRKRGKHRIQYDLYFNGKNIKLFYEQIGFKLRRKQEILEKVIATKKRFANIDDIIPVDNQRANKASYIKKNCQYLVNDNIFYDQVKKIEDNGFIETFDINVPEDNEYCANGFCSHNTGEKIRGQRAGIIAVEEFNAIPQEIFEVVIKGFAMVSTDPVERLKQHARIQVLRDQGLWTEKHQDAFELVNMGNQTLISGTAGFGFQPYARYWRRYKKIIESKGDKHKLEEMGEDPNLNWKDFCVIRIPYDMIPSGFMDEKTVAHSKATMHTGLFQMELGCIFIEDSNGFFKRSLIESCVTNKPVQLSSTAVQFHPRLTGDRKLKYIIAIDPASESDKFSIVVLELHNDHRRIVYCWTTTKTEHRKRVNQGAVEEENFYAYAARKIRELIKVFPSDKIVIDSQGGGYQVNEALHDKDKINSDEQLIWEIVDPNDPKDTDHKAGLHIVELVYFADAEYTRNANHGLRKDMEDKAILFPMFDPLSLAFAAEEDNRSKRDYDTLEDCTMEIEELKNELTTIVVTQTQFNNREHWDTPEIKQAGGKKGRLRKDRYTSLLMANATARKIQRAEPQEIYTQVGGFAHLVDRNIAGSLYTGLGWENLDPSIFTVVRR